MTLAIDQQPSTPAAGTPFETVADVTRALADVPADRILLNPAPGTATERDLLYRIEVEKDRVELIERTLVRKANVGYEADFVSIAIAVVLQPFVSQRRLGSVGGSQGPTRMSGGNVRLPDLFFISRERLAPAVALASRVGPVAPDLAVEVLSKSNRPGDMRTKRRELFASGTRLIWEFEPAERTVAVYTSPDKPDAVLDHAATLTGGDVLPGFSFDLATFWSQFDEA